MRTLDMIVRMYLGCNEAGILNLEHIEMKYE